MLVLPATLTHRDARDALRMLAQALKREPDSGVAVDASALAQLDTSALAVLLECRRLSQASGRAFEVRHAPKQLVQLARLYGVDEAIGFADAPATAPLGAAVTEPGVLPAGSA